MILGALLQFSLMSPNSPEQGTYNDRIRVDWLRRIQRQFTPPFFYSDSPSIIQAEPIQIS